MNRLSQRKQLPVVGVSSSERKVRCYKEQYCIGTWNVRIKNQGKLEVVKQEMARVKVNIWGINELKWTGMGKFNSHDHYIYYCGQIRSDQISRSVVSDLKTQPPLTNAFPPISHYFSFLPAPFHPIPLSFLSFLSCCSSFSDAPVIANTGQKPLRAMVWGSFPNHKSDHITSLIETLQNASPVVTAGALEPSLRNQLEAILTAQGTHTNSWCAYICMTEVKILWNKLTLNSCDALWYFLFYSILLFYKIQFHTQKLLIPNCSAEEDSL